jgi:hypothetical protein
MSSPNQRIIGEAEKNAAHTGGNDVKRMSLLASTGFMHAYGITKMVMQACVQLVRRIDLCGNRTLLEGLLDLFLCAQ